MDTNAAVAPGPVANAAPAASAPEPVNTATFDRDAAGLAPDALIGLIPMPPSRIPVATAPAAPAPVTPPAAVAPTAPAAPAAEPGTAQPATPPAATPPADPNAPAQPSEGEAKLPNNYRLTARDTKEAMVMYLVKHDGKSLLEATREVYGNAQVTPTETPATPQAPTTPAATPESPLKEFDTRITSLTTEAAELQTQIDKAKLDGELATAIDLVQKQGRIERQLEQTKAQRENMEATINQQTAERHADNYRQLQSTSASSLLDTYPQFADPNGSARQAFNAENQTLRNDPRWQAVFDSPQWPEIVGQRVAAKLGLTAGSKATTQPGQATPPVAQPSTPSNVQPTNPLAPTTPPQPSTATRATAAEVVTPSATSPSAAFSPSVDSFDRDLGTVSAEQRLSALYDVISHAPVPESMRRMAKGRTQ